jgi:DNA-binding MarR family transcriptional regulator
MKKGYIIRQPSQEDGREYNLELSEKFYGYSDMLEENVRTITRNVLEQLTPEEIAVIDKAADILNKELDARAGLRD